MNNTTAQPPTGGLAAAPTPPAPNRPTTPYRLGLHALAVALVVATLVLIGIGGIVTSLDAGMVFPRGHTTGGYWSLIAPLETWWNQGPEARSEHIHRIQGYLVGMLSIALLVGVWRTQKRRPFARKLAVVVLLMVIAQGLLGIFRVEEVSRLLAMVHGVFAQVFLCVIVLMAATLGKLWIDADNAQLTTTDPKARKLRRLGWSLLAVYLIQLILGAAVRHTHSGLAIPDYPLHYGSLLPPFTQAGLEAAVGGPFPGVTSLSLGQVWLHFAHRVWAYLLVLKTAVVVWRVFKVMDWPDEVMAPTVTLASLLTVQVILGITTVLTGAPGSSPGDPNPVLATTHQTIGAMLFASAAWFLIRIHLAGRRGAGLVQAAGRGGASGAAVADAVPQVQGSAA